MPAPPTSPQAFEERVKWRVLHLAAPLIIAVALAYGVAYALSGLWRLFGAEIAAVVVLGITYGVAWKQRDVARGIQWLTAVTWALLAAVVVLQGGLTSPALVWLLVLPPLALLADARFAKAMAALTALFALGLFVADRAGWLPAPDPPPLLQRAVSAALITALFFLFAGFSLRWRNLLAKELS